MKPKPKNNRTLITGATGFLGKHLVEHLQEKGEKNIRVLTTNTPDWMQENGLEIIEGSITSPEIVKIRWMAFSKSIISPDASHAVKKTNARCIRCMSMAHAFFVKQPGKRVCNESFLPPAAEQ